MCYKYKHTYIYVYMYIYIYISVYIYTQHTCHMSIVSQVIFPSKMVRSGNVWVPLSFAVLDWTCRAKQIGLVAVAVGPAFQVWHSTAMELWPPVTDSLWIRVELAMPPVWMDGSSGSPYLYIGMCKQRAFRLSGVLPFAIPIAYLVEYFQHFTDSGVAYPGWKGPEA